MPQQSRTVPPDSPVCGVFVADAGQPPVPPPNARALEFTDEHGVVIAYTWVAPEHAGPQLLRRAWRWHREEIMPVASSLKLLR